MAAGEVIESRVDWLTCSAGTDSGAEALVELGRAIASEQERQGSKRREWSWQGYHGQFCGHAFVGSRRDGSLLRLGGDVASEWWRSGVQLSDHVSRIDLAVTVRVPPDGRDLATDAYHSVQDWHAARGKPRFAKLIVDNRKGRTLYVGKRVSEVYLRLYDKGVESRDPRWSACWRYEVECKGTVAGQVASQLAAGDESATLSVARVHDAFTRRGVVPCFQACGTGALPSPIRGTTDDERRLAWLRTQVRGSVLGLCARGQRSAVLEALGLGDEQSTR